jgi:uncharacterized protein YjbI with pentapeptide repeats
MNSDAKVKRRPLDLSRAFIRRTDFSYTDLERANLTGTDCTGAVFRGADFKNAILDGTILRGADLTDARNLTREQLARAVVDETTILPDYLR